MTHVIKAITIALVILAVHSLEPVHRSREPERNRNLYERLVSLARRYANKHNLQQVKKMYKKLTRGLGPKEIKKMLRKDDAVDEPSILVTPEPTNEYQGVINVSMLDKQAVLVEKELTNALKYKKSALLDRPYVEKKGRNDFLVIRPDIVDPFVTVIPNAIYYNIEKKCVNWLDDCSLNGIRARLLRGMQSP